MKNLWVKISLAVVIAIIIISTATVLVIKVFVNEEFKNVTSEELKAKILSAFEYTNYTYECKYNGINSLIKVKDNIFLIENGEIKTVYNLEKMKLVALDKKTGKTIKQDIKNAENLILNDFIDIRSKLSQYENELNYEKMEKVNNRKCYKVNVGAEKLWIDEETGFILKYIDSNNEEMLFNITINNVTDDEMKIEEKK